MNKKLVALAILFVVMVVTLLVGNRPTTLPTNQQLDQLLTGDGNTLKFGNDVLATKETVPHLFIEESYKKGGNALFTYGFVDDVASNTQLLRVDKMVVQYGNHWSNNATAFYRYNFERQQYDLVLVSSKEQNQARFPQTEIVSQNPLTVKFYYDVAKPQACYGPDCRAYWVEHYRYDSKEGKFVSANGGYKESYQTLLSDYENLNKSGCDLGSFEQKVGITLEEVYNHSKTDYCSKSSRDELEKFMLFKQRVADIANFN